MNSDAKAFTIVTTTFIVCLFIVGCLAMVQNHMQTLKYIEGGYSQQQTNVGMQWVKE